MTYKPSNTEKAIIAALIAAGRKDVDNTDRAIKSRLALIDLLISSGFNTTNTLPKAKLPIGYNGEWKRDELELIGAASIKINGRRLSDEDLEKFADEGVSNKVLLAGTPKGSMSRTVTWKGNTASWMGKIRDALEERENATKVHEVGTLRTTTGPKDVFLGYIQKAYAMTFKNNTLPAKDLAETQRILRDAAKSVGGTINDPAKK
jgi:hypothetical protein